MTGWCPICEPGKLTPMTDSCVNCKYINENKQEVAKMILKCSECSFKYCHINQLPCASCSQSKDGKQICKGRA